MIIVTEGGGAGMRTRMARSLLPRMRVGFD